MLTTTAKMIIIMINVEIKNKNSTNLTNFKYKSINQT